MKTAAEIKTRLLDIYENDVIYQDDLATYGEVEMAKALERYEYAKATGRVQVRAGYKESRAYLQAILRKSREREAAEAEAKTAQETETRRAEKNKEKDMKYIGYARALLESCRDEAERLYDIMTLEERNGGSMDVLHILLVDRLKVGLPDARKEACLYFIACQKKHNSLRYKDLCFRLSKTKVAEEPQKTTEKPTESVDDLPF